MDLVLVSTRCHFCGAWYQREIEPEWARLVREHGLCTRCLDILEGRR